MDEPVTTTPDQSAPAAAQQQQTQPPPAPAAESWNGEIESLEKQPWWPTLGDDVRNNFKSGYGNKVKNLERGYQEKYRTNADERKKLEADRAAFAAEQRRVQMLASLYGGDEEKANAIERELTELRSYKTQTEQREAQRQAAAVAAEEKRLTESYGDIFANETAAVLFERLATADMDLDEAAAIVRAKYPAAPAPRPDPWDRATQTASRGDQPPAGGSNRGAAMDFDALLAQSADRATAIVRKR